jgi:hypothetical protein
VAFYRSLPFGDNVGYSCWFETWQTEFLENSVLNEQDTQVTDNRRCDLSLLDEAEQRARRTRERRRRQHLDN